MSFKIALDAGHCLNTAGKRFLKSLDPNETREWVRNSLVCDKIEVKLQGYEGYELLRVDDRSGKKDISTSARCKAANNFKADFYLSMHHNAGIKGGTGGGIVVYAWKKADATLQAQQKQLYDLLIAHTGLKGNRAEPLGKANFDVLVYSNMPAILVEAGFMDSATDVPIILTDAFAEQVADACVKFFVQIGNLKKKEAAPVETPIVENNGIVKKGDLVSIKDNATYYSGKSVPSWVKSDKWYVSEVKGDRAIIDKNEKGTNSISSPINVSYLTVVTASAPISTPVPTPAPAPAPAPVPTIEKGSTVRLNKGAKTYDGKSLASFVYNRNHKVKEIKGDRVVITYLGVVVAAVSIKDLTLA